VNPNIRKAIALGVASIALLTIMTPLVVVAQPQTPVAKAVRIVDEAALKRGHRSEVVVLGTAHLSRLPADFDTSHFAPLLDRLAHWQPQLIAVESASGAQCDYLRAYAFAYEGTAETYCVDPAPARAALGLDGSGAESEVEKVLSRGSVERLPSERRRLAALFLAIGEPDSALVQWLRLPGAERVSDASLTQPLVAMLEQRRTKHSENVLIAAGLAVRLGLERIYPVDDHTGDRAAGETDEAYGKDMTAIWNNRWANQREAESKAWDEKLRVNGDIVGWYRWLNSPEAARLAMLGDFAAAGADQSARASGRLYLAYWETRNLRMIANIRQAIGPRPGIRALTIVGNAHKAYYERYLGMLSDVKVVSVDPLLK
jgi:hypothetical protein